jgi:hypothetical protein
MGGLLMKADASGTLKEQARAKQDWKSSMNRDMCGNCIHLKVIYEDPHLQNLETLRCALGGFSTTRQAICLEHLRK